MTTNTESVEAQLIRALHEIADEIHVEAPNEPTSALRPGSHTRSRAAVSALVAAAFGLLVVFGAIALLDSTDNPRVDTAGAPSKRTPREVPAGRLLPDEADVAAYMKINASDAQIDLVRDTLESSKLVKRYAYLDKPANYRIFKKIFANDPDLIQNVDPEALPTTFLVFTRSCSARAQLATELSALAGVDDAAPARGLTHTDARNTIVRSGRHDAPPGRCATSS